MLVSEEETRSNSNLLASPCRPKEHVLLSPIVAVPFRRHPTIGNNTGACPLQNSGFPCQRYSVPEASLIEVNSAPRDFKVTKANSLDYEVGDTVRHIKFGVGIVKEIVEGGRDYEVTVEFDKVGVKKMFASFAKLKKI